MADQDDRKQGDGRQKVQDVVSDVTVKALREFSSGSFHPEDGKGSRAGSRPTSAAQGSRPTSAAQGSRPTSAAQGSRPTSAAQGSRPTSAAQGSRPTSAAQGSRPTSAAQGSRPTSAAQGSRPTSAAQGSRPGSAAQGSRPGSGHRPLSLTGSRPPTASKEDKPTTPQGSRPQTPKVSKPGTPQGSKPGTPQGSKPGTPQGSKPGTPLGSKQGSKAATPQGSKPATPTGSKPTTPQGSRPQSATHSARPASGSQRSQPQGSDRGSKPGSAQRSRPQTAEGGDKEDLVVSGSRPTSARQDPVSDRPMSIRVRSGGQQSDREGSEVQSRTSHPRDGEQRTPDMPVPEPTRDSDMFQRTPTNDDSPPMGYTDLMSPMGAPGGGDSGDEEDEDDEMAVMDEEEEEDSEGESEMVVLDPDHPLMKRFQKALRDHLDKQNEKVTLELRELLEAVKTKHGDREDIGVELYGVQQELARHQMLLEKNHDDYANLNQQRTQVEKQLYDVQHQYKDQQTNVSGERKEGAQLQAEVENLALRLFYMDNAKEDVRSDIAVMKRAAEKAESEVVKSEMDKQQQDLYVDRLVERVDKLRQDIALFEAQIIAQTDETRAAKEALTEAHMEIEAISLEKKQLYQQWNSSLIGMRRRDEAHSAMQEALTQQEQRILSLQTEIEGFKRNISKEQEQNEKLTLILAKTEQDIVTVRKMLTVCQAKHDALKNEYATYTRMLHETEQALNRATTDKTLRMNEVNALRKQIEREYLEKVRLEDQIIEELRGQLTMDKASQYTDKITKKLRTRTRDMDQQIAVVENDISKETLEVSHTKTRVERLQKSLDGLDEEIKQKNEIISKSLSDITKRNATIERKQGIIDQHNKKLELMISQAGGVELGPLEIQINSLHKSIEAEQQEIVDLQQMWLRDQNELVQLSKDKDGRSVAVTNLQKQLTILSQKKLRTEGTIDTENCETNDIKRNIRNMENDMIKLNILLHKERGTEHELEQGNVLMENEFIGGLREAELGSIQMQQKLDSLKEEKERLLNSLVEAERQIMLWEKKTQLAKETRAAVDSEVGQGEIRAMKAEIHRMQVRYTQLMKQQERMIQEMEKAVSRRDTIVSRGDAQSKMNKKVLTKGTFQRQMNEAKKKIKTTIQDANNCDEELREFRQHQQALGHQLEEKQLNVQQLQNNSDSLDGDLERLVEVKQRNMSDLLARQQKAKYYQQVKDGKYTRLCRTDTALDNEQQKQVDRMQNVIAIVDRLSQEYPHVLPGLRRVMVAFGSRGSPGDDSY